MDDLERFERGKHLAKLVEEFKLFVMDSTIEGHADNFQDQLEYLESALENIYRNEERGVVI